MIVLLRRLDRWRRLRKARKQMRLLCSAIEQINKKFDLFNAPAWKKEKFWKDFTSSREYRQQVYDDLEV